MKQAFIILTLLLSQVASAQSLKERRIKQEMLDRADLIISKVESIRESLKTKKHEIPSEENMAKACETMESLFKIFPEHLKAIGGNMDLFSRKTVWMKNAALDQLIYINKQALICREGKKHEYVDPSAVRKELGNMLESLEKQRKRILKEDTDYNNTFHYEYEFTEEL
jgi:hypothetical protein